jgi:hypothetical protein
MKKQKQRAVQLGFFPNHTSPKTLVSLGGSQPPPRIPDRRSIRSSSTFQAEIPRRRTPQPASTARSKREREDKIKMTQKQTMFKGQTKKKSAPPSRHGKAPHIRKGSCPCHASYPVFGLLLR